MTAKKITDSEIDDLNEELDVLAATEIMGWHKTSGFWLDTQEQRLYYADDSAPHFDESGLEYWEPTEEGSEHQAMMVVRKMDSPTCKMQMSFYGEVADTIFINPNDYSLLGRGTSTFGRAIIIAALSAVRSQRAT